MDEPYKISAKMKKVKNEESAKSLLRLALVSAFVALLFSYSCRNTEAPVFTNSDAILGFINNDLDAKELFTANLFPGGALLIDSGGDSSKSIVIANSIHSVLTVNFMPEEINTVFGDVFAATVSVKDVSTGDYVEKPNQSGSVHQIKWKSVLERRALFFRLDGDAAEYLGWDLVGYDMGRPLHNFQPGIKITRNPASPRSENLTAKTKEFDLNFTYPDFTYLTHIDILKPNDSVEIETRGLFSISANTTTGFRTLTTTQISSTQFRYGFIVPLSDPQQRFFFLITFQEAPFLSIDSLKTVISLVSIDISPRIPPDTTIDSICLVLDTTQDTVCAQWSIPDTSIDSLIFDTTLDTNIVPRTPPDTVFEAGESWTFPYSVRP